MSIAGSHLKAVLFGRCRPAQHHAKRFGRSTGLAQAIGRAAATDCSIVIESAALVRRQGEVSMPIARWRNCTTGRVVRFRWEIGAHTIVIPWKAI